MKIYSVFLACSFLILIYRLTKKLILDSLTHIVLGSCIGEAFFKKGVGKKAMFWGALAQSIPDIDFIAAFWLRPTGNLLAHRGFTHSILFGLLIVPLFAFTADRVHKPHNITRRAWLIFFGTEVFVHLLIDGFNNYGVGWLEPFSHTRFSFNTIYVADPFFSVWPAIAFVFLIILNRRHQWRRFWWKFGVFIPVVYLLYCCTNKVRIDNEVRKAITGQNIPNQRYFTTPAPLQNWLWYIVSGDDRGYYVAYRSLFDRQKDIQFQYFPRNDSLLLPVSGHEDLQKLIRFSKQFYTIEKWNDTLVFNDLRFGQIIGWENPQAKFVFHYYLQYPEDNKLVVQRGRFAKWDWTVLKNFLKRIKGN